MGTTPQGIELGWPENLQWGYGRPPGISDTLEVPPPGTVEVTVTRRGRGNPGGTVIPWTTELATKPVPPVVMITPVLPGVILTGKRYRKRSLQRTASKKQMLLQLHGDQCQR